MTYLDMIAIAIFILVLMIGVSFSAKSQDECKLKAVNESHMSVDDARKLCAP